MVGLGFTVNMNEYNRATKAITDLGNTIQSQTRGMSKNFIAASTAITGALVGVTVATAGVIAKVSDLDMEYQKLALHMWTTKQQAKEMKLALDAMGESAEDVAWIPELRAQYDRLIQQGQQLQTPGDASGQLANMRQIRFEWERMKLEAQYSLEWIAYYLIKYLSGPLKGVKDGLKEFNDKISQTMPQWTEKVARWLTMIINLGKSGVRFMSDMVDGIMYLFDQLPKGAKATVAALAGIGASLWIFGPVLTLVGSLVLLLEDFYGYLDGRKSSKTLAPIWKQMLDWFDKCKSWTESVMPKFKEGWETISSLLTLIKDALIFIFDILKAIAKEFIESGTLKEIGELFWDIWKAVGSVGKGLSNVITLVNKLFNIKGNGFISIIVEAVRQLAFMGKTIAAVLDMVGLALQGKFSAVVDRGKEFMKDYEKESVRRFSKNGNSASGSAPTNDKMMALAKQASLETGIAAEVIYAQWGWESEKFSSQLARENNNFAGLTQTEYNGAENKQPDGNNYYKMYNSPEEFAQDWVKFIKRNDPSALGSQTTEEFAQRLKNEDYYGDSVENYTEGLNSNLPSSDALSNATDTYAGYRDNATASYTPTSSALNSSSSSSFTTGDVNFNVSSDTAQLAKTIEYNIKDANGRTIARQTRELSGVFA